MSRWRIPAALVALYILTVVVATIVLERRDRLDCIPGDDSCNDLNAGHVLVFALAGFFVWVFGVLVILYLTDRFAKRNAKPSW